MRTPHVIIQVSNAHSVSLFAKFCAMSTCYTTQCWLARVFSSNQMLVSKDTAAVGAMACATRLA